MAFDYQALVSALVDHSATLGFFEKINAHEPKNAPGARLTAHLWVDQIVPVAVQSSLAATSGVVVVNQRIQVSMLTEPQDAIDPGILAAVDAVLASLSGDFDLNVAGVRAVDLLGQSGFALGARAGYLNQDGKLYRVMTVTIPILVNDLWTQAA